MSSSKYRKRFRSKLIQFNGRNTLKTRKSCAPLLAVCQERLFGETSLKFLTEGEIRILGPAGIFIPLNFVSCLNAWPGIVTSSGKVWITSHKKLCPRLDLRWLLSVCMEFHVMRPLSTTFSTCSQESRETSACHPHLHRPFLWETLAANLFKTYNQQFPSVSS